jgi:predicted secreted protein
MPQAAMGTKILIGANSIAELTSIGGLELSADTIETTNLDSGGWRTFMQGLKDGGEVSISGTFNPGDTNGQIALYNAFNSGALLSYTILFPFGAAWNFSGIVTGINTGAEMEDNVSFEGTIKVSGQPSLGLTPSGGLTALSLTGTGGALTPAFNANNNLYAFSGVTATSVTLTATAVNHQLVLFVDGVLTQTLNSGQASAAIPITAVGSKKLMIMATEAGKAPKLYEITLVKTA